MRIPTSIAATMTAAAITFAPAISAAPAHAADDTPGCVTKDEYRSIRKGWTITRVKKKFGTNGSQQAQASAGGFHTQVRSYTTCTPYGSVAISFDKRGSGAWKVVSKAGVFVS